MTVTVLAERRPRPKPAEAADLASRGGVRLTERRALELLLRLSDGRPIERTRGWIAKELGVSKVTAHRAIRALVAAGLVTVVREGIGHTCSAYLVDFTRLTAEVPPADVAVLPGESDPSGSGRNDHPEWSKRSPRVIKTTTQSDQNDHTQRACPRDARALPSHLIPLTPDQHRAGTTDQTASPVASDGAPSLEKCKHGRTARQGCRRCGTDSRTAEKAARQKQAEQDRAAALERARARLEEAGTPRPDNWRELVAASTTTEGDTPE